VVQAMQSSSSSKPPPAPAELQPMLSRWTAMRARAQTAWYLQVAADAWGQVRSPSIPCMWRVMTAYMHGDALNL
jgi:hypothetical protein